MLFIVAERLEQRHHLLSTGDVEVARWFIGQKDWPVAGNGPCDCNALLLTSRKLVGNEMHAVTESDLHEGSFGSVFGFLRAHAGKFECHGDVVNGGQVVKQVKILENPSHQFSAHIHHIGWPLEAVGSLAQGDAAIVA